MNILLEAVNLEYLFGSTTNLAVLPEHKGKLFTLEKCKNVTSPEVTSQLDHY